MDEPSHDERLSLHYRLRGGVVWYAVGSIAAQGSVFLASLIVANLLGRESFGQFGIVLASILTLVGMAQAATGVTAMRYVAEYRQSDPVRAGRVIRLCSVFTWVAGVVMAFGLMLAAPWLAEHVLKAPQLRGALTIAAIAVLFGTVNGYQTGSLAGMESYRPLAFVSIIQAVLYLVFCALGSWLGDIEGAITGVAITACARWLLLGRALRHETVRCGIPPTSAQFGQERDILWRFALPVAASALISLPALWIGQTLLARQAQGYAELALYTAANNLRLLVLFAPAMINNVGMSILSNQVGANSSSRYRRLFWVVLAAAGITSSAGAIAVGLLGPWLLSLFGQGFAEGRVVLHILLLSTVIESIAVAINQVTVSHEKMWLSLVCIGIPRDAAVILLAWLLTPAHGAGGLAAAYLLAWSLCLTLIVLVVARLGLEVARGERHQTASTAS